MAMSNKLRFVVQCPSNFSLMVNHLNCMSQFEYKEFYRRNRPHIHPPDSTLFVTFRLAGSIPKTVVNRYRFEKAMRQKEVDLIEAKGQKEIADERIIEFHRNWFLKFDEILDRAASGPMWLGDPKIREIVYRKLIDGDGLKYRLDAFSLMSNHAHIVFKPNLGDRNLTEKKTSDGIKFVSSEETLPKIMQSIKGATARECNIYLGRKGAFWETESFDHVVRDDNGFARAIRYTLKNPVKARLVSNWRDWPGNYVAPRLLDRPWLP